MRANLGNVHKNRAFLFSKKHDYFDFVLWQTWQVFYQDITPYTYVYLQGTASFTLLTRKTFMF
ncbi:hypothetical protein CWC15_18190 [Pseudoalteromonas spongiae]|nr:hypothetical protein CWC15_18190 [Pseudoalteromonas spongiae]